jgi:hypothetical protein
MLMRRVFLKSIIIGTFYLLPSTIFSVAQPVTAHGILRDVNDIQRFEPAALVYRIDIGNDLVYDRERSELSRKMLKKMADSVYSEILITYTIHSDDTDIQWRLKREMVYLCELASNKIYIDEIKITPLIDSILQARKKRFGLFYLLEGFERTDYNYKLQRRRSSPYRSGTYLYMMIVDAVENNIRFFKEDGRSDNNDPTDENEIRKWFNKLHHRFVYALKH